MNKKKIKTILLINHITIYIFSISLFSILTLLPFGRCNFVMVTWSYFLNTAAYSSVFLRADRVTMGLSYKRPGACDMNDKDIIGLYLTEAKHKYMRTQFPYRLHIMRYEKIKIYYDNLSWLTMK